MDWTLEVVVVPVGDAGGNSWAVQQISARATTPLLGAAGDAA